MPANKKALELSDPKIIEFEKSFTKKQIQTGNLQQKILINGQKKLNLMYYNK